jgi:hypothetical protein
MLTMTAIDILSDPQLLSLGPEGVVQRSPALPAFAGQPWVGVT